jgi:ribosomal protein S4
MRFLNKYKNFQSLKTIPNLVSNRVLNFKRPKWKKIQKNFKRKKIKFVDIFLQKATYKNWNKVKKTYKKGLELKRYLDILSDVKFSISYYKKFLSNQTNSLFFTKNLVFNFLIKKFFRLDLLLWKLKIFSSPYESRQYIKNNVILVNNKSSYEAYFLKKGDIIKFKSFSLLNYKNKILNNKGFDFLQSFIEIDYYTNCIIILKDLNTFSIEDFFLILYNQSINLKYLLYYIKIK